MLIYNIGSSLLLVWNYLLHCVKRHNLKLRLHKWRQLQFLKQYQARQCCCLFKFRCKHIKKKEREREREREARKLIFVRAISTNHPDVNYKIGRRGATKGGGGERERAITLFSYRKVMEDRTHFLSFHLTTSQQRKQ